MSSSSVHGCTDAAAGGERPAKTKLFAGPHSRRGRKPDREFEYASWQEARSRVSLYSVHGCTDAAAGGERTARTTLLAVRLSRRGMKPGRESLDLHSVHGCTDAAAGGERPVKTTLFAGPHSRRGRKPDREFEYAP